MALGSERDGAPLSFWFYSRFSRPPGANATFLSLQHPMQVVTLKPAKVEWCDTAVLRRSRNLAGES